MVELRAIELIAGSLYDSVQGDPKARETMALAQYLSLIHIQMCIRDRAHTAYYAVKSSYDDFQSEVVIT